jgi:hypothetical protein
MKLLNLRLEWYSGRGHYHFRIAMARGSSCGKSTRSYLSIDFQGPHFSRSMLLQHYRPGASLLKHTDSTNRVDTLAFELVRPKSGRLVNYDEDGKSWLRGRIQRFRGNRLHEVTECSGHRVSLLFQKMYLVPVS